MIVDPSEQSKRDIRAIALYLSDENPPVAFRFLDAIEETFSTLSLFPEVGHIPLFDTTSGLRVLSVKGFKHFYIFYRLLDDVIRIDRVADGRRDLPTLFAYLDESGEEL